MKAVKIALFNQKGGVGKTTATKSIASELAKNHGKKVLIIDSDPSGNATDGIRHQDEPAEWYGEAIRYNCEDNYVTDPMNFVVKTDFDNLYLMPNKKSEMLIAERALNMANFNTNVVFQDLFDDLNNEFDYILLDCGAGEGGKITQNVLTYADYVLIPFQPSDDSFKGYENVIRKINEVKRDNRNLKILGSFISMYSETTTMSQSMAQVAKSALGDEYIPIPISDTVNVDYARNQRIPLAWFSKNKAKSDYEKLTDEIVKRVEKAQENNA